jgi:hypothetical protein
VNLKFKSGDRDAVIDGEGVLTPAAGARHRHRPRQAAPETPRRRPTRASLF